MILNALYDTMLKHVEAKKRIYFKQGHLVP